MSFHPNSIIPEAARVRVATECAQCGERLFVPEWSEHFGDRSVRHLWQCEDCGYTFETTVSYVKGSGATEPAINEVKSSL